MSLEADLKSVMSKYVEAPNPGSLGSRVIMEKDRHWVIFDCLKPGEDGTVFDTFAELVDYVNNPAKWEVMWAKAEEMHRRGLL